MTDAEIWKAKLHFVLKEFVVRGNFNTSANYCVMSQKKFVININNVWEKTARKLFYFGLM